mgnify:CR=1 FL=1
MKIDTDAFASAFQMNMTEDDMKELFASLSSSGSSTYEGNLQKLGYADFDEPSSISIYPKTLRARNTLSPSSTATMTRWKKKAKTSR